MPKKPKKTRRYVRQPALRDGVWTVEIVEGLGPFAPVVESIPCAGGRESAFQAWRQIMKDLGRGL